MGMQEYLESEKSFNSKKAKRSTIVSCTLCILGGAGITFGILNNITPLIVIGGILVGLVILASLYVNIFLLILGLSFVKVVGTSMMPFLQDGQELGARKIKSYGVENLRSGDVVIISTKAYQKEFKNSIPKDELFLIKRLVLLGEGTVKCENGSVFVKVGNHGWKLYGKTGHATDKFGPYHLKKDEIFFLGDNYDHSTDSRYLEGKSRINRLYKVSDIWGVYAGKTFGEAMLNISSGTKPKMMKDDQKL